jgi:hypothetical protein
MKAKTPNDSPGRSQSHFPGDPPTQYPQDFLAEAAAAAALIPQLKAAADLYNEFHAAQVPFQVRIIQSNLRAEFHYVTFLTKNATAHGLYIERLTIALPEKRAEPLQDIRVQKKREGSYTYDERSTHDEAALADWLPQYVKPASDLEFTVKIPVLKQQIHEQVPYLIGTFSLSHLNEKKPHAIEQEFRVRWKSP